MNIRDWDEADALTADSTRRTEAHHGETRGGKPGPFRFTHRDGTAQPGARLRIVAAPGGVAFVEVEPAMERK
jgi:hypothetical protein